MTQRKGKNTKKSNKTSAAETKSGMPKELLIFIGVAVGLILELCNFDVLGLVGGWVKTGLFAMFGVMAYVFPIMVIALFAYYALSEKKLISKSVWAFLFLISICALAQVFGVPKIEVDLAAAIQGADSMTIGGGFFGAIIVLALYLAVGKAGCIIISIILACLFLILMLNLPVIETVKKLFTGGKTKRDKITEAAAARNQRPVKITRTVAEPVEPDDDYFEPSKDRKKSVPMRTLRNRDEEVFRTKENETVIRIVHTKKKKVFHAPVVRANRKAGPLRKADFTTTRDKNIGKGISEGVNLAPRHAGGDALHEITFIPGREEPKKINKAVSGLFQDITDTTPPAPVYAADSVTEPVMESPVENYAENYEEPASEAAYTERRAASRAQSARSQAETRPAPVKAPSIRKTPSKEYKFPPLTLLARKNPVNPAASKDLDAVGRKIELVLENFGVNCKVTGRQIGPAVTRFELQPEMGTRVNKITSLADDLKMNLAVTDIRIEAPIPGKNAVGIEIPNAVRETVVMRELIENQNFKSNKSLLAFAAGKDISGEVIVSDLAKMPHLLVAGTTGSGKSVFLNSIIMGILYRAKPSEVGFIIIDPKRIEFGVYSGIPHLMKDVVTDPGQAVSTLRWAVSEMLNRYNRMKLSGVRDSKSYNAKYYANTLSPEEENPRPMVQIVIVIDELADLMMVASKEVEQLICRLAQLARAAGIHLIVATQRPSVDVVTGLIKSNIPARVALTLPSGTDSRTIIDMYGAEKLLGYGDMLFSPTGAPKPFRVQGAFISDDEVAAVVEYLKRNNSGDYFAEEAKEIENYQTAQEASDAGKSEDGDEGDSGKFDEYFYKAGVYCISQQKASSSMIQRQFSLGFNRAARIIDQMYDLGVIGPPVSGAKPREILMDLYTFEETFGGKE
ncbi:MAG: DNA translocase FtsK [Parasporobacterium sp.]|nr:DNA translocase FtsK [Parasporobacterium sp.]